MRLEKKDLEIENAQDDNEIEIRVYKQKTNFIKYCHDNKLKDAVTKNENKMDTANTNHTQKVKGMKETKTGKRNELSSTEDHHTTDITNLQQDTKVDVTHIKERLDADVKLFEQRCDEYHDELKKELESRREAELKLIVAKKDKHLDDMFESHEHRCEDMKVYFDGVERQQEMDIEDLDAEIRRLKKKAIENETKSNDLRQSNETNGEELRTCSEKVVLLTSKTKDKEKDSMSLRNTNARLSVARKAIVEARIHFKELQDKFVAVDEERNNLQSGIEDAKSAVVEQDLQTKAVLQQKLENQQDRNTTVEAHLMHISASAGLKDDKTQILKDNMEDTLMQTNQDIDRLRIRIANATTKYNDARLELQKRGISVDELDSLNARREVVDKENIAMHS